jgi:transposase
MDGVRLVLTDRQWLLMEPLLPGKASDPGVTAKDRRQAKPNATLRKFHARGRRAVAGLAV